ncbi:MAG: ribonuclease HII [Candidatus Micrarchaeota archaeon]|nr:ribonuclease HII [Candidatus Micrarchaeota archaeon]
MIVVGADEAGRGCVLGPLVICAYSCDEKMEKELKRIGVRDSKLLSPGAREKLFPEIARRGKHELEIVSAEELTKLMSKKVSLNEIEAIKIADALKRLKKKARFEKVIVDSPDPVASKFEKRIRKYFDHEFQILCENKADYNYPCVGAASILAKVTRDAELEKIKKTVGEDFGSGYTHDERTIAFLKRRINDSVVKPFVRHKWVTAKRLKTTQMELGRFV